MPSSISRQEHSSSVPARRSAQYFHTSLPEPRICPRQLPRSIGPAGTKIAGRFALVAPITSAGTVLSQPPSRIDAVGGIGAQRFLRLHRQQVAIEHRARLHERFAERQHRDLHREPARLPDAALDLLGAHPEVRVAGIGVAPGVQDRDDRLAGDVLGAEAGLLRARAVAERAADRPCRTSDGCGDRWAAGAAGSRVASPAARRATGASCVDLRRVDSGRQTAESVRTGRCPPARMRDAARARAPTHRADPRAA